MEDLEKLLNFPKSSKKDFEKFSESKGYSKSSIEIPSNSVTLESRISNRDSRTKGDTINRNGAVFVKFLDIIKYYIKMNEYYLNIWKLYGLKDNIFLQNLF